MRSTLFAMIVLLATMMTQWSVSAAPSSICSVCYSQPCPFTPSVSLLFCAQFNTTACGPCSLNCTQCQPASLNNTPFACTCNGTSAPTGQPTAAPVTAAPTVFNTTGAPTPPTLAPTAAPTVFSQCQFCGGTSPPNATQCPGSSSLLMLCQLQSPPGTCAPCPTFCSFCFPPLMPTPAYTCTCPPTQAPTAAPTRVPTGTPAPTQAPTPAPVAPPVDWQWPLITVVLFSLAAFFCIFIAVFCIVILPSTVFDPNWSWTRQPPPNILAYNSNVSPQDPASSLHAFNATVVSDASESHRQRTNLTKRLANVV